MMKHFKDCSGCGKVKHRSEFNTRKKGGTVLESRCKKCRKARYKVLAESRRRRPGQPEKTREYFYRYNYGISIADYEEMLTDQSGRCAICGVLPLPDRNLHVDHDHATGRVRGLLCRRCNTSLGQFDEDEQRLRRAAQYLEEHRSPLSGAPFPSMAEEVE